MPNIQQNQHLKLNQSNLILNLKWEEKMSYKKPKLFQ